MPGGITGMKDGILEDDDWELLELKREKASLIDWLERQIKIYKNVDKPKADIYNIVLKKDSKI